MNIKKYVIIILFILRKNAMANSMIKNILWTHTSEMTDKDSELLWFEDYYDWGKLKSETNIANVHQHQPFRLQNQYRDEETGRFINQDLIGLVGGENFYTFALNTTKWVDILGLYNGDGTDGNPRRAFGQYKRFYKFKLKKVDFTDCDKKQFQQANTALAKKLEKDPVYAAAMYSKYPKLKEFLTPRSDGSIRPGSPPGLTWHHHNSPGKLELVDRQDHQKYHKIYHPDSSGGREKWGGGKKCRNKCR